MSDPSAPVNGADAAGNLSRAKPYDAALRDALEDYRRQHGLSQEALGRELGVSSTAVSRYLSGKPEGDVFALERVARDVVRAAAQPRAELTRELVEIGLVRPLCAVLEAIRRTGDRGVVVAEAGAGMTCAVQHYLLHHPSSLGIAAAQFHRGAGDVLRLMWSAVETRGWDGRSPRVDFLRMHLRGSRRLLVVDRAGRLTMGARRWLRDFSEDTGCPLALCGDPSLLESVKMDADGAAAWGHSRRIKTKAPADAAAHLISRQFPGQVLPNSLYNAAAEVAAGQGRLHALDIRLRLTADLLHDAALKAQATKLGLDVVSVAFESAGTQMLGFHRLDLALLDQKGGN